MRPPHLSKARDEPPAEVQSDRCPQSLAQRSRDQQREDAVRGAGCVVGVGEAGAQRWQSGLLVLGGLKHATWTSDT